MGTRCGNCFNPNYYGGVCAECGYDSQAGERKYPLALPVGSILYGKYRTGRVLGQGGFGITYKAQDIDSGKIVAIKEYFPKELATRSGMNSAMPYGGQREDDFEYGKVKFIDEAKCLAKFIDIPGIVDVYNYFEENGTAYFTMEYADNENLEKYISKKGGKLTYEEAQAILMPVFNALKEIHNIGIIHRDVAPDNIMITPDGRPLLIDFGLARGYTENKSVSMDVVVKYGFAPIEQYKRHTTLGPTTDIYAAAATYYYAITGRIPPESVDRIGGEDPLLPPSAYGAQIDKKVEDALFKALSVQPADRYQSMGEFIDGLTITNITTTVPKMLERAYKQLSQKEWAKADVYLDMVLENEPQNAEAYVGKLMCELRVEKREFLGLLKDRSKIIASRNYNAAMQYGSEALKAELRGYAEAAGPADSGTIKMGAAAQNATLERAGTRGKTFAIIGGICYIASVLFAIIDDLHYEAALLSMLDYVLMAARIFVAVSLFLSRKRILPIIAMASLVALRLLERILIFVFYSYWTVDRTVNVIYLLAALAAFIILLMVSPKASERSARTAQSLFFLPAFLCASGFIMWMLLYMYNPFLTYSFTWSYLLNRLFETAGNLFLGLWVKALADQKLGEGAGETLSADASAAPALGLGWHKFLVYFSFFAGAALNVYQGVTALCGSGYSYYYSSTDIWNIVYGCVVIALAAYIIYTRNKLAGFRKGAVKCVKILYVFSISFSLVYMLLVIAITNTATIVSSLPNLTGAIVMAIININYYNRRAQLFVR